MDSKVVFISHPYYAVNNPSNNYRIYKKNKKDKWYYIQCKDKEHYRKEINKYICGFYQYSRNEDKSHSSMLDYYMGSKKSDDVMKQNQMRREEMAMLKDGTFIKDNMVEKMQKQWSNYLEESNVQLSVLSLYQDYVDENINIKDLQKEVATKLMPKFLRYCGYDKPEENLEWIVSLHCDRENNYHFHIAWVEKNKCYKFNNNKLGHKLRLKVSDRENNFMKRQVSLTIERAKLYSPALTKINKDIEELQKYFNPKDKNFTLRNINDLELEEKIIRLGFLLSEIRNTDKKYIKYGSLPKNEIGDEIRNITKSIKKELFKKYPEIKNSKKEIYDSIKELNEIFLDIDKRNNISDIGFQTAYDNKLIKDKLEKSDNYILNSIVNHALYNYDISNKKLKKNSKIEFEDLISEAAINIYKNEKYETYKKETYKIKIRKRVLENFFINGGYRNTDKLSNALRRLSKDSEKAAEQFYEMFTDNEKNVEKN